MTTSSALETLQRQLPCRDAQLEKLHDLFAFKDEPFVESIYVYGGPSCGKSIVVTSLLKELNVNFASINLIECYSAKILFESILNKMTGGHKIDHNNKSTTTTIIGSCPSYGRCDNLMDFIQHLKTVADQIGKCVLVLDNADELRNMDANLLPAFLRLKQLTGVEITVILVSELVWEKYFNRTGTIQPFKIYFPQYNKDELLEVLSLDFPYAKKLITDNCNSDIEFDEDFFKNYLNIFLSVFYRACRDLTELRYMSRVNFMKYCEPIISKKNTVDDQMALWRNIAPILKSSLEVLYLRMDFSTNNLETKSSSKDSLELPFYAKYLLIAAYLASYNSTKDDKKLFMKFQGRKTKSRQDAKMKSKVSEKLNTQLGPKPFTFDRLLAIFYSILDEKVGFNNNLLVQVSSLVELRLLSTVSDIVTLDGQKYKCNVNYDFIHNISKMVGFNIRKYLSDFSHF